MFKNPLRKYQQGGAAPTADQQKLLAAFIEWLPKRVKEFQGMQPEQIAQALDGMTKTPEGQKQVQQLMQQFQQELQQGGQPAFRNGGKIHDFICKHAKGGSVDCGCGGIKVQKGQDGLQKVGRGLRTVMRTTPIGKYLLAPEKNEGYRDAEWGSHRLPNLEGITNRRGGIGQDIDGNPVYYLGEVVNGTSANSYYFPNRNIIEQRIAGEPDQIIRTYQPGSDEFEAVYNRFQPLIPSNQPGGKIVKTLAKAVKAESKPTSVIKTKAFKIIPENVQSPYKWLPSRNYIEDAIMRGTDVDDLLFALKRDPKLGTNPAQMFGKYSNASKIKLNPTKEEVEALVQKVYNDFGIYKSGGKVEKAQEGNSGTISQGKPRSKIGLAIDNNPTARHFVEGARKFTKSPVFRWPLAGLAAYTGYNVASTPFIQGVGEVAPKLSKVLFPTLTQFKPSFWAKTAKSIVDPSIDLLEENISGKDLLWPLDVE